MAVVIATVMLAVPSDAQQGDKEPNAPSAPDPNVIVNQEALEILEQYKAPPVLIQNTPSPDISGAQRDAAAVHGGAVGKLLKPPPRAPRSRLLLPRVAATGAVPTGSAAKVSPPQAAVVAPDPAPRQKVTAARLEPLPTAAADDEIPPAPNLPSAASDEGAPLADTPLADTPLADTPLADTRTAPPRADVQGTGDSASDTLATSAGPGPEAPPQIVALPPPAELRLVFEAGATDLSEAAKGELLVLAQSLLQHPEDRIQLLAYAQGPAEATSQARRLSLSRALTVRSFLIKERVPAAQIDVRAMGNQAQDGPPDRVDVLPARL